MRARFAYLLILLLLASTTLAGQLSPDLEQALTAKSADDFVSVWIKLPPVESADQLKRVAAPAASAVEQHASMIGRLKVNQASAQQGVIEQLRELEARGRAKNVRSYWITNMVVAEVATAELAELSGRFDIDIIYAAPEIVSVDPVGPRTTSEPASLVDSSAAQLTYTKATLAWAAGFTGAGRLVCTFDSGIDGDHPALAGNWKGNDGNWRAAWFDPVGQDSVPHTIVGSGNSSHGTEVLGLVSGYDSTIGYAIGVARDAQWISAAVTDLPTGNSHAILEAFEWAADPDGNPNTISDRPDVINHSWGFNRNDHSIGCEDLFFEAIDNIEALGIVNIFAAGNSGPGGQTIANPANRALSNIDCFAVGAVSIADTANPTVASYSSRGPSDCDSSSIKPNIVAPGTSVRTCLPGGAYTNLLNGTSFAAPQVAGLVALMRQKNPNATVDEIKTAILNSASSDHFGGLPNNTYGWGELNCLAAVNALSATNTQPNVRVYDFTCAPVAPGDTLEGTVTVKNLGAAASNVSGTVSSSNPDFTVLDGAVTFGNLAAGETKVGTGLVRIAVSSNAQAASVTPLSFQLTVSGQPISTSLAVLIEPARERGLATHTSGLVDFTVSNFGMFGLGPSSIVPSQGAGFTYNSGDNYLWEGGLIMATSPTKVSSGVHSYIYASDYDFTVADNGAMEFWSPGGPIAQRSRCATIDRNAGDPINVRIDQECFSFNAPDDNYVIVRFILTNESGAAITGLRFGLYTDWDAVQYNANAGGYETTEGYLWTAWDSSSSLSNFRGVGMVQGTMTTALTQPGTAVIVPAEGGDGFTPLEKFNALAAGTGSANTYKTATTDLAQLMAVGPLSLANGEVDTVAYAIMAGVDLSELTQTFADAQIKYTEVTIATDVPDNPGTALPSQYALRQNYPNPFNPSTQISFDLPKAADYRLRIFNILGQEVYGVSGYATAGTVDFIWDASGEATGVYFYRLETEDYSASRKMMLLK